MLQIGVTVYCLALWVGIVFGTHATESPLGLLTLALVSLLLLVPLAPKIARCLLGSLTLAPNAPPLPARAPEYHPGAFPGAPGTPGAAHARAPDVASALA